MLVASSLNRSWSAPVARVRSGQSSLARLLNGPNLFSGPVVERKNVLAGRLPVAAGVIVIKSSFHDRRKPKRECYDHRRYDDRESQNKVSEEVHYWRIA